MLPNDLYLPSSRSPIIHSKILLVEGKDAFYFFKALLRCMDLLEQIEIRNFGGIQDLTRYLKTLTISPGFIQITSLGIVRDAEVDARAAFHSVCNSLNHVGLRAPLEPNSLSTGEPSTAIFILPDCFSPGMLESLCLKAVQDDPAFACIDNYFECLKARRSDPPGNIPKAQIQVFLASRERPGLLLGEAAQKGYWPWNSSVFDPLKHFILAL
jgi:hypothetical protein